MFDKTKSVGKTAIPHILKSWMMLSAIILSTVAIFACNSEQTATESTASNSEASQDNSKVVAKWGDEVITESELNKFLDKQTRFNRYNITEDPEQLANNRKSALDELIGRRLVMAEAKKLGIGVDDAEIQKELDGQLEAMGRENMEQQLQELGLDIADVKSELVYSRLSESLFDSQLPPLPEITDDDIRAFYEDKKDEYFRLVELAHILIKTPEDGNEAGVQAARDKAMDLIKQINEGADFGELAKANSEDPGSAQKGGVYPPTPRGRYVKEFEDAAFSLAPGEVTQEPVRTAYGFHIIKTLSFKTLQFDEVKEQIKTNLPLIKKQEQIPVYIDKLRKEANVEVSL